MTDTFFGPKKVLASVREAFTDAYPNYSIEWVASEAPHSLAALSRKLELETLIQVFPLGYRILDIGGNVFHHLRKGRLAVHCCAPILDARDAARNTLTNDISVRKLVASRCAAATVSSSTYNKKGEKKIESVNARSSLVDIALDAYSRDRDQMRCYNRAQDCTVPAKYAIALHSTYDIPLSELGSIMDAHGTSVLVGTMIFDPIILFNPSGFIASLGCLYEVDTVADTIDFHFKGDSSFSYHHKWSVYLAYFRNQYIITAHNTYLLELQEWRCGIQYFRLCRATHNQKVLPCILAHKVWMRSFDEIKYVTVFEPTHQVNPINPSAELRKSVQPIDRVLFFDTLSHAFSLTAVTLRVENIFTYMKSKASRVIINGVEISRKSAEFDPNQMRKIADTIYVMALLRREDSTKVINSLLRGTSIRRALWTADVRALFNIAYSNIMERIYPADWILNRIRAAVGSVMIHDLESFLQDFEHPVMSVREWFELQVSEVNPEEAGVIRYDNSFINPLSVANSLYRIDLYNDTVQTEDDQTPTQEDPISATQPTALVQPTHRQLLGRPINIESYLSESSVQVVGDLFTLSHGRDIDDNSIYRLVLTTEIMEHGTTDGSTGLSRLLDYYYYLLLDIHQLVAYFSDVWARLEAENPEFEHTMIAATENLTQGLTVWKRSVSGNYTNSRATGAVPMYVFNGDKLCAVDVNASQPHSLAVHTTTRYVISCSDSTIFNQIDLLKLVARIPVSFVAPVVDLVEGVPGCGKTQFAVSLASSNDLMLATTRGAANELSDRLKSHDKSDVSVFTVDSFLLNNRSDHGRVIVDEGLMLHPGVLQAIAYYCKASSIIVLGDSNQLNFISRISGYSINYPPNDVIYRTHSLAVSTRCPVDVASMHAAAYPNGFRTTSTVYRSVECSLYSGYYSVLELKPDLVLTFTQQEKLSLTNVFPNVMTINEAQGRTAKHVVLIRTLTTDMSLYNDASQILVATTRHTQQFTYFSVVMGDTLSNMIKHIRSRDRQVLRQVVTDTVAGFDSLVAKFTSPDAQPPRTPVRSTVRPESSEEPISSGVSTSVSLLRAIEDQDSLSELVAPPTQSAIRSSPVHTTPSGTINTRSASTPLLDNRNTTPAFITTVPAHVHSTENTARTGLVARFGLPAWTYYPLSFLLGFSPARFGPVLCIFTVASMGSPLAVFGFLWLCLLLSGVQAAPPAEIPVNILWLLFSALWDIFLVILNALWLFVRFVTTPMVHIDRTGILYDYLFPWLQVSGRNWVWCLRVFTRFLWFLIRPRYNVLKELVIPLMNRSFRWFAGSFCMTLVKILFDLVNSFIGVISTLFTEGFFQLTEVCLPDRIYFQVWKFFRSFMSLYLDYSPHYVHLVLSTLHRYSRQLLRSKRYLQDILEWILRGDTVATNAPFISTSRFLRAWLRTFFSQAEFTVLNALPLPGDLVFAFGFLLQLAYFGVPPSIFSYLLSVYWVRFLRLYLVSNIPINYYGFWFRENTITPTLDHVSPILLLTDGTDSHPLDLMVSPVSDSLSDFTLLRDIKRIILPVCELGSTNHTLVCPAPLITLPSINQSYPTPLNSSLQGPLWVVILILFVIVMLCSLFTYLDSRAAGKGDESSSDSEPDTDDSDDDDSSDYCDKDDSFDSEPSESIDLDNYPVPLHAGHSLVTASSILDYDYAVPVDNRFELLGRYRSLYPTATASDSLHYVTFSIHGELPMRTLSPMLLNIDPLTALREVFDSRHADLISDDTQFDSIQIEHNDISITAQNAMIDSSKLVSKGFFHQMDHLRYEPLIRTPQPDIRPKTARQLLLALSKRNWDVVSAANLTDTRVVLPAVEKNCFELFFHRDAVQEMARYADELVTGSESKLIEWMSTMSDAKVKSVLSQTGPVTEMNMSRYSLMIKTQPKNKLAVNSTSEYLPLHNIVFHSHNVNALFGPVFRVLYDRFVSLLKPSVHVHLRKSPAAITKHLNTYCPLDSDQQFLEVDFSKYDKSQLLMCHELEMRMYERLGMHPELLRLWRIGHMLTEACSYSDGVRARFAYQRKTGDVTTCFGNSIVAMMAVAWIIPKQIEPIACYFVGDDSLLALRIQSDLDISSFLRDIPHTLLTRFNLPSKVELTTKPYFCSSFIVNTGDGLYMIPDPLKTAEKLGKFIPFSFFTDERHERWISFRDNNLLITDTAINIALRPYLTHRYGDDLLVDLLMDSLPVIINCEKSFFSLYELNLQ